MGFWKEKRRKGLRAQPLSASWIAILDRCVPLYRRLPPGDQAELHGHIHVFLDEKRIEGCAGLEITDEICVVLAAQACVLLLHRDSDYYADLFSILVYPSAYMAPVVEADQDVFSEYEEERSGETWSGGSLVVSWDDVTGSVSPAPAADSDARSGNGHSHDTRSWPDAPNPSTARPAAGADAEEPGELVPAYNVVLHEFAHQLDLENGAMDGAPRLGAKEAYERWARVFDQAIETLRDQLESGIEPVIDDYAAEDAAEFFAVATESFFETPFALRDEFPEVYRELESYYRQDPAAW